jgi:hypothetical protein
VTCSGFWRRRSDCYFVLFTTSLVVTTITFTIWRDLGWLRLYFRVDSWSFAALIWSDSSVLVYLLGSPELTFRLWSALVPLIRCTKGTPIIKKAQPLPFYQRRNNERRKKTEVLTLNKYMAMGPSGARCQEWPCWLVTGSKLLLCSALLCSDLISSQSQSHIATDGQSVSQ